MIKKSLMIGLILISVILMGGCELSEPSYDGPDEVIVCDSPYIQYASGCCLDQNDNKLCDSYEESVILESTELLDEYQEFLEKESAMLEVDDSLVVEFQEQAPTQEDAQRIIKTYSAQADQLISAYKNLENFIALNQIDLETEGIDTTKRKASIIEERLRIRANLQVMREVMDEFLQDNRNMDMLNIRNKLVYQIKELDSIPLTTGTCPK